VHDLALGTAFMAGMMGSMHCMAMCGGIVTALGSLRSRAPRWQSLLYHLGRIGSYTIAGSIAGGAGALAGTGFNTAHWAEILRLGTALLIVLIGLSIALGSGTPVRWLQVPERWGAIVWRKFSPKLRAMLPQEPVLRSLGLGMIWGWLPCGLVYSVLFVAAFAGSAAAGGATMAAFGLGTLPALAGLGFAGHRWVPRRGALAHTMGGLIVACGLWTAAMPIAALFGGHQHPHQAVMSN
jgi:uncharacterized protein